MTPPETIGSTLGAVAAVLATAGLDEPRRRARRLVAVALGLSASEVFAQLDRMITEDDGDRVSELLSRMVAHEPLSRITGIREFWGLEFTLSPDTLDPRPESETIVETVLARANDRERAYRILDLGTGCGCLLLALLSELSAASGMGIDVSPAAIATARGNAERLGPAARADFAVSDWARHVVEKFDVVVANPPYIATADIADLPPEVRDFDPFRALDGGADGLEAYRAIAAELPGLLKPCGLFVGEIGQGQADRVAELIAGVGLIVDEIVPDLAGIPRCVAARRACGEKMVGTAESPA
jgi:release factor glutamine methyltransferase